MQQESRASKVKRFSEAALFHLEDVTDPGTEALTFALVALTEAGTDTASLGTEITDLGKTGQQPGRRGGEVAAERRPLRPVSRTRSYRHP